MVDLTEEEEKAIRSLKRLAKKWPETLWLYSASGSLVVMKKNEDGEHAMTWNGYVDQHYIVDDIDIENDGGDW